jgi:hypothetical protein
VTSRLADDVKLLQHNRQLTVETKMLFSGAVIDKGNVYFDAVFTKVRLHLSRASFFHVYCCFHLLLNEYEQHNVRN